MLRFSQATMRTELRGMDFNVKANSRKRRWMTLALLCSAMCAFGCYLWSRPHLFLDIRSATENEARQFDEPIRTLKITNGPFGFRKPIEGKATNVTVITERFEETTFVLKDYESRWQTNQRFYIQKGTNVAEAPLPGKWPVERFHVAKGGRCIVFECSNPEKIWPGEIVVAELQGTNFLTVFRAAGKGLLPDEARENFAFSKIIGRAVDGERAIHCYRLLSNSVVDIIGLRDSSPGSGSSYDYAWLPATHCLCIHGTGYVLDQRSIFQKYSGPRAFSFVYCAGSPDIMELPNNPNLAQ